MDKLPQENVKFNEILLIKFLDSRTQTLQFQYVALNKLYEKSVAFKWRIFRQFRLYYSIKITKIFLDTLFKEMIYNDAVYMFPQDEAYMFIAQQSIFIENVSINNRGLTPVRPYFIYKLPVYKHRHLEKDTLIYFHPKYYKMLEAEIAKGHIYPSFDDVVNTVQNGKHSRKQSIHPSREHFDSIAKAV